LSTSDEIQPAEDVIDASIALSIGNSDIHKSRERRDTNGFPSDEP
jgi:hypothetical protein